jgi:hypothetical protein
MPNVNFPPIPKKRGRDWDGTLKASDNHGKHCAQSVRKHDRIASARWGSLEDDDASSCPSHFPC